MKRVKQRRREIIGLPVTWNTRVVIFVGIFAVIGVVFLLRSFALSTTASLQAELGTGSAVTVGNDVTAAGAKFISFSGGGPVVNIPTTIAPDCSANVTAALQTWINSVPNGSTLLFTAGACYRSDQTIILTDRSDLVLDGNGATFKAISPTGDSSTLDAPSTAARTRAQWRTIRATNLVFKNMTLIGANPNGGTGDLAYVVALEAQHGFDILSGSHFVEVANNAITDIYGDCVYVGASGDINIHDNHCERNGRQGMAVSSGARITMKKNYIGNTRRATIDLEPNVDSDKITDVLITENTVGPGRLLFIASAGQGEVSNVTVSNNSLAGRAMNSIIRSDTTGIVPRRHNWIFDNNTADTGYGSPSTGIISISGVDDIQITNNTQPGQVSRDMVIGSFANSTGIIVKGNTVVNGNPTTAVIDSLSQVSEFCGNRVTETSTFDLPVVCP